MRFRTVIGAAVMVASACAGGRAIPIPTEADAARAGPGVTVEALRQGRDLYVARCGGCHRLYPPDHARRGEWPAVVLRMRDLFTLPDGEARLIEDYLVAFTRE